MKIQSAGTVSAAAPGVVAIFVGSSHSNSGQEELAASTNGECPSVAAATVEVRTGFAVENSEVQIMVVEEAAGGNLGLKAEAELAVSVAEHAKAPFAGNCCFEAAMAWVGQGRLVQYDFQSAED